MRIDLFRTAGARRLRPLAGILAVLTLAGCASTPSGQEQAEWPSFDSPVANEFVQDCRDDLARAGEQLRELESGTFAGQAEELLGAINRLDMVANRASNRASLTMNVHPEGAVREAATACRERAVDLYNDISLSRPLYRQIEAIDQSALNDTDRRYVEDMIEGYQRSGVDKDEKTRERIRALNERINQLGQTFNRNIREDVREVTVDSADRLDGLPEDYIEAHEPNEQGKIVITTNYPDYFPVMQYAHDDDLRLALYREFRKRGYPDNEPVLRDLLEARHELAQLLGYEHFAQYATENKMIKTPERVQSFIDRITKIARPRADLEYNILLERLREIDPEATFVGDWQKMYLQELIKKERFEVDAQKVRQYFPYEAVRQGIFDLTETLFGVTISTWDTDTWHESVEAYEIREGDKLLGRFYLDMHPREGKYKHAAAFSIQDGVAGVQEPIKALVCNFPGVEAPGYMEHSQVETFLHEFGHLLHGIFAGDHRWLAFSGIKTEWDFVEAPSQMLEEWVWDAETLQSFSRNSEGESIPDELVEKMNLSRDFGQGLFSRHQMFYAAVSLNLYNRAPEAVDFDTMMPELQARYSPFPYVDDTYFHTSFGHLYGYSAIYYTYMWSKVIAADMFGEFEREGMRNPEVSQRYRDAVLAPGGSRDAADLVEEFLGRPYSFEAFAESLEADDLKEAVDP